MAKWKQVGGDMSWSGHGGVFARDNKGARSVDLVRIEPWLEHDSSAIPTHGLYIVDEGTFDYEDMGVDKKNVQSAMQSVGMDEQEYKKLAPVHKAEVIASAEGYGGESRSTSDLMDALPDKPENIEFWGGKETEESIRADNDSMRREAVEKLYYRSFSFGDMPDEEALELAWGPTDESKVFEIDDNEKAGLGYAKLFAHSLDDSGVNHRTNRWVIHDLETFATIVEKLAKAPEKLTGSNDLFKVKHYLGHPENTGDTKEEEDEYLREMAQEMAESAHELAKNLMENLGFTWH